MRFARFIEDYLLYAIVLVNVCDESSSRAGVCLLVGCLSSQQHYSVSQGRVCTDNLRAATLRLKLQIKLSTSPSHSILTPISIPALPGPAKPLTYFLMSYTTPFHTSCVGVRWKMRKAYRASFWHILKKVTACFSSSVYNSKCYWHLHFWNGIQSFP